LSQNIFLLCVFHLTATLVCDDDVIAEFDRILFTS